MTSPVCSIILPVRNLDAFVGRAVSSVLEQTEPDIELICIDDASTDCTSTILARYADGDGRIKLLTNEKQRYESGSRNRGAEPAAGKFMFFLDGDDEIRRDFVEVMSKGMGDWANIGFFNSREQDDKGGLSNDAAGNSVDDAFLALSGKELDVEDKKLMMIRLFQGSSYRVYRTDFYKKIGLRWPEEMWSTSDVVVFYKALLYAQKVWFTKERLFNRYYRKQSLSRSRRTDATKSPIFAGLKAIERNFRESGCWDEFRDLCYGRRIAHLITHYNFYDDIEDKKVFLDECLRQVVTGEVWRAFLDERKFPARTPASTYWNPWRRILDRALETRHPSLYELDGDELDRICVILSPPTSPRRTNPQTEPVSR